MASDPPLPLKCLDDTWMVIRSNMRNISYQIQAFELENWIDVSVLDFY